MVKHGNFVVFLWLANFDICWHVAVMRHIVCFHLHVYATEMKFTSIGTYIHKWHLMERVGEIALLVLFDGPNYIFASTESPKPKTQKIG